MRAINESFEAKTILITGATGFLGKVVLEKLLRACPEFARVYLLIRAEDAGHSMNRMENDIFSSTIFDRLKSNDALAFARLCREKIRFVVGDSSLPRLGLVAVTYLDLLARTDLVINIAASTDFAAPLDAALLTNTFSVRHVTEFIEQSRHARLLHVSTCYVNESGEGIAREENLLRSPRHGDNIPVKTDGSIDFEQVFSIFAAEIEKVTAKHGHDKARLKQALVDLGQRRANHLGWHNVYTFTKWLGERTLENFGKRYHCTVVRPSIIESCLFEPAPGWIEGFKVADPLFYGSGTGMIQSLPGRDDTVLDLIPVDLVSNAIFLACAELLAQETPALRFYQSCSSSTNPLTLGRLPALMRKAFAKAPPKGEFFLSSLRYFSFHTPLRIGVNSALGVAKIVGAKKMANRLQNLATNLHRLNLLASLYLPYMNMRKIFDNQELRALHARAAAADRIAYPIDAANLDWDDYLVRIHVPGLAKFVLQDSSVTAPPATSTNTNAVARTNGDKQAVS